MMQGGNRLKEIANISMTFSDGTRKQMSKKTFHKVMDA